jgi:hypothetical protein
MRIVVVENCTCECHVIKYTVTTTSIVPNSNQSRKDERLIYWDPNDEIDSIRHERLGRCCSKNSHSRHRRMDRLLPALVPSRMPVNKQDRG